MALLGKKQVDKGIDIIDKLVVDKDKKATLAAKLIESENNSGNLFTKLARPSIIYTGLIVILCEIFGVRLLILQNVEANEIMFKQSNAMMEYFIFTWGAICTAYIGGRTFEKTKMKWFNKK